MNLTLYLSTVEITSQNMEWYCKFTDDSDMAEKYAELAKDSDSYNAAAFVNLANCSFEKVRSQSIFLPFSLN